MERRQLLLEAAQGGEGAGARLDLVEDQEVPPGRQGGAAAQADLVEDAARVEVGGDPAANPGSRSRSTT